MFTDLKGIFMIGKSSDVRSEVFPALLSSVKSLLSRWKHQKPIQDVKDLPTSWRKQPHEIQRKAKWNMLRRHSVAGISGMKKWEEKRSLQLPEAGFLLLWKSWILLWSPEREWIKQTEGEHQILCLITEIELPSVFIGNCAAISQDHR